MWAFRCGCRRFHLPRKMQGLSVVDRLLRRMRQPDSLRARTDIGGAGRKNEAGIYSYWRWRSVRIRRNRAPRGAVLLGGALLVRFCLLKWL